MKTRRKKGRRNTGLQLVELAVVLLLIVGGAWLFLREEEPKETPLGDYRQRYEFDHLIEVDGVKYRQRQGITSLLLIGVDHEDAQKKQAGYRNGGQSDFLRLLVIDDERKTVSQLAIDRDTMTPITVLSVLGENMGTRTEQLCLAHSFGLDEDQSCALTADAVSELLLGTEVTLYASMDLNVIAALNDFVGGVEVTLEDDFTALDPEMKPGTTLTLKGMQAHYYVRKRTDIGEGTNASRMVRQEDYLNRLGTMLDRQLRADQTFAERLLTELEPYLTTNVSRGRMINEVWKAKDYERMPTITPSGVHLEGEDGFVQFIVDEDQLRQTVLELVYEPIG